MSDRWFPPKPEPLVADRRVEQARQRFDHADQKKAMDDILRELKEHTRILNSIERKLR